MVSGHHLVKAARFGRLAFVLLIVGVAFGATGVAAQAPPIVLCKSGYTGAVREIKPEQNCLGHETRLEFQSYEGGLEANDLLQQQIDALDIRVTALEDRMDTAEGDIDSLEGRMDTAEGDIDDLEGRMDTAEGDIDDLETRMTTTETNVTNLDTRVTNIRNFFTGVANNLRACFTGVGSTYSIEIPALTIPALSVDLGELGTFDITPAIPLFPGLSISVFNAGDVIPCLNGVATASGL